MTDIVSRKKAAPARQGAAKPVKRAAQPSLEDLASRLRAYALSLPEAWEDHPWGESVAKVGKKVFAFLGRPGDGTYGFSVKLPQSADGVLHLPFTQPTGYGLGKSGWVSVTLTAGDDVPPLEMLCTWIDESYRAIAPKKLVKQLDERAAPRG